MDININLNDEHVTKIIESFEAVTNQNIMIEGEFRPTRFVLPSRQENETDKELITRVLKDLTIKIVEIFETYKKDEEYKQAIQAITKENPVIPEDLIV
jgi:hypothetical protein